MIKKLICFTLLSFYLGAYAQEYKKIKIGLTTSVHLIFENNIVSHDMGLGVMYDENGNKIVDVLVQQPEKKRLKLAAGLETFEKTNLFVETEKYYYNFIVEYTEFPQQLLIPVDTSDASLKKEKRKQAVPMGKDTTMEAQETVIEKIKRDKNKAFIDATSNKLGLQFVAEQLYIHDSLIFIKLYAFNNSSIQFDIGYIGLSINERTKGSRRSGVVQDVPRDITKIYDITSETKEIEEIFPTVLPGKEVMLLICTKKFTIEEKKILSLEIWEGEGERKNCLEITSKELVSSKIM